MKKFKSAMIAALSGVMLFSSCTFLASGVQAKTPSTASETDNPELLSYPRDAYEFSAGEMLNVYALNQSSNYNVDTEYFVKHRLDITGENAIQVRAYTNEGNLTYSSASSDYWSDGRINAVDASNILVLEAHVNGIAELPERTWPDSAKDLQWTLAKALNLNKEDVTVETETIYQKIAGFTDEEKKTVISSATGVTAANNATLLEFTTLDRNVYIAKYKERNSDKTDEQIAEIFENAKALPTQETVRAKVTTKDGVVYRLALANDNKFYLVGPKEEQEEPTKEFKTTLDYSSKEQGKMDGSTYLPPYYANEEKNAKKDLDATAIIKSTTTEEIVKVNGVELTADGKANSEGWFYKDVTDKTVIAKVYKFDDYDNTKFNGAVSETVKLTGAQGGEDTQKPSIRWTFRLIDKSEKENADGSITVTLTYNLPVDPDSIPDDWSPVYDEDGKTIHAITKTIKKGEDYNKDVTVKRNGDIDEKVTTNVKKTWEKLSPVLPQTGAFTAALVVIVAGVAVFAITRYRKMSL